MSDNTITQRYCNDVATTLYKIIIKKLYNFRYFYKNMKLFFNLIINYYNIFLYLRYNYSIEINVINY